MEMHFPTSMISYFNANVVNRIYFKKDFCSESQNYIKVYISIYLSENFNVCVCIYMYKYLLSANLYQFSLVLLVFEYRKPYNNLFYLKKYESKQTNKTSDLKIFLQ